MPDATARTRRLASPRSFGAVLAAATLAGVASVGALGVGPATPDAAAQTSPTPIKTIVVRLQGQMTVKFDKAFLKTIKRSGASVKVKSGATYASKQRTATLPVDATTAVTFSPANADVLAKGTIQLRRKDKRTVNLQSIMLRIRESGADVAGTVRGRPNRQIAPLTVSPTIDVQQTETGASFVDLQMLVSPDLARAARQAKIKGVKEGALLGLITVQFAANLPNFQLPTLNIPGLDPIQIPGIDPTQIPQIPSIPGIDPSQIPIIPGING